MARTDSSGVVGSPSTRRRKVTDEGADEAGVCVAVRAMHPAATAVGGGAGRDDRDRAGCGGTVERTGG